MKSIVDFIEPISSGRCTVNENGRRRIDSLPAAKLRRANKTIDFPYLNFQINKAMLHLGCVVSCAIGPKFNLAPIFRSKWMTHSRHVAGRWRRRWGTRRAATTWADNPWLAAVVWSNERGLQVIFRWSALDRRRLSNGVRWLCNQFIHSSWGEQHTFTWPTFPPSTCTAPPLKPNTNCPMRSAWTEGRQFDGKYENLTVKSKSPINSLRVRYLKICS